MPVCKLFELECNIEAFYIIFGTESMLSMRAKICDCICVMGIN